MHKIDLRQWRIQVPNGWELRVQETYIEPEHTLDVPLATQPVRPKPRANIVVSRRAATSLTPEAESDAFFEQTAKAVPTLRRINKETFVSPDGSSGTSVTISFEVAQVMLVQKHVFRIDGGILTQLVATVDEARKHELEEGLEVILQSFESTS